MGWPVLLVSCLKKTGYDPRGYPLQGAIAAVALVCSRFQDPALNVNFAFQDPLLARSFGPAPLHLAVLHSVLVGLVYGLTHLALRASLPLRAVSAEP